MDINVTGCCAVMEISELRYEKSAKAAMLEFCDESWGYRRDERLSGFYTFTGVVKAPAAYTKEHGVKYAPNFAAFIKKNNLGAVTESVARPNRINHPDHMVKVYVWAPNQSNLKKWYKKNRLHDDVNQGSPYGGYR